MATCVIANLRVFDANQFELYKELSTAAVKACDGRFLIRGGRVEAVEGEWIPSRLTVIEFSSWETAVMFVRSIEYSAAREARRAAASVDMLIVEGV